MTNVGPFVTALRDLKVIVIIYYNYMLEKFKYFGRLN